MFSYFFAHLPYYAIVYPTEYYYYYYFSAPGHNVSGNLRLVEIDNGKIGMGYFDKERQELSHHKLFSMADGLEIKKLSESFYKLTYKGKSVYFRLPVAKAREQPKALKLHQDEQFVAKIREESGIIFYLFFSNNTRSFYYLLDEERPVAEPLKRIQDNLYRGERTDYIYYYDSIYNRKTLVAIRHLNVQTNNYFDGPFDQVPPFLHLRDMIYRVYPYTQIGSGIDLYGYFLDIESTRVAISPYQKYYSLTEIIDFVDYCEEETQEPSLVWACLTYEDKKDFHKDSPMFTEDGRLKSKNKSLSFL